MSRAFTLIAFAISNLLLPSTFFFHFLFLASFHVGTVGSEGLYSAAAAQPAGGASLTSDFGDFGAATGQVENNDSAMQPELSATNQQARLPPSLQLIFAKLIPSLNNWSGTNNEAPSDQLATEQPSALSINEHQEQSSATMPNLSYVMADNGHNHNNYEPQQPHRLQNIEASSGAANSPIRQLISPNSNSLFYPATEQPSQPTAQQLPLLLGQHKQQNNNLLPNAAHYSNLASQTQQSFWPQQQQQLQSGDVESGRQQTLYQHTRQPYFSMAPQTHNANSQALTLAQSSKPAHLITPYTSHNHYLDYNNLPTSTAIGASQLLQPLGASPFKPLVSQAAPEQSLESVPIQQHQSNSPLSSMLAFLVHNKANLSNLIQLLPLIAQTISVLPRVFPTVNAASSTAFNGASASLPEATQTSLEPAPSLPQPQTSILSLIQSSAATNNSIGQRDKLTERFQLSQSSSSDSIERPTLGTSGENQTPSSNHYFRPQSWLSSPIFTQILPQIASQIVSATLSNSPKHSHPAQYEFPGIGIQKPDVSYSLEPSSSSSSSSSLMPSQSTLARIRNVIASLASLQRQQSALTLPFRRTRPHSPEAASRLGADAASSTTTTSAAINWLEKAKPLSQLLNSGLLNRVAKTNR